MNITVTKRGCSGNFSLTVLYFYGIIIKAISSLLYPQTNLGNQPKPKVEPPVTPTKPANGARRDTAATPTKRVSFMPEEQKRTQEVDLDEEGSEVEGSEMEYSNQEEEEEEDRLYRSQDYKQDPNVSVVPVRPMRKNLLNGVKHCMT